jgi:hypothetical protein
MGIGGERPHAAESAGWGANKVGYPSYGNWGNMVNVRLSQVFSVAPT